MSDAGFVRHKQACDPEYKYTRLTSINLHFVLQSKTAACSHAAGKRQLPCCYIGIVACGRRREAKSSRGVAQIRIGDRAWCQAGGNPASSGIGYLERVATHGIDTECCIWAKQVRYHRTV